jgi:acyl-CoA synthetase (AMP-forming)/AMP-acid ligase II
MYTLGDIPRCGAIIWPDNIAVVFEGKRYTYKQFNERINRFANFLSESGCKKGDGLAVMAENCSKYLEVYFAAAKIGMRVTPINVRLGDDEIVFIANDSETSFFVVGEGYEEKVKQLKKFGRGSPWIIPCPDSSITKSYWKNHQRRNLILINIMCMKMTWPS